MIFLAVGPVVLALSIWQYSRVLTYMRIRVNEFETFNSWISSASFLMMVFLLVGYIIIAVSFAINSEEYDYLLVSFVFFFGALSVLCMVNVQKAMAKSMSLQLLETLQSIIDPKGANNCLKGHSEYVYSLAELIYKNLPGDVKEKN